MSDIDTYASRVGHALAFDPRLAERLVGEITNHLEESAECIGAAAAIARFGSADALVRDVAKRSLGAATRTLGVIGAIGVVTVFAIMELRSTLLAVGGTTIFGQGSGARLFSVDAIGFVVAALAAMLVFVSIAFSVRYARVAICSFHVLECGLVASIASDALATAIHVGRGGGDAVVASIGALAETAIAILIVIASARFVSRASRAADMIFSTPH